MPEYSCEHVRVALENARARDLEIKRATSRGIRRPRPFEHIEELRALWHEFGGAPFIDSCVSDCPEDAAPDEDKMLRMLKLIDQLINVL